MLLGSLVGGIIEVFVSRDIFTRFVDKRGRFVAIILGASIGLLLPVCECAIVPIIRRLLKKGAPLGSAIAYLLAGPIFNPIVATSTLVAYNYQEGIVLLRLILGLTIAITVASIMEFAFKKSEALIPEIENSNYHCCHHHHFQSFRDKIIAVLHHSAGDFFDIARFLIIGAFITGIIQVVVVRQEFIYLMNSPLLAIILMMLLALLLNLCSESDAFIAASFQGSFIPLSAQMGFMILGPMLDIKLLLMYLKVFKKSFIAALSITVFGLVFSATLIMELMTS